MSTRARRVARGLIVFACVMALCWVIALVVTGHDAGGFRILAVLPAAVGITMLRMFVPASAGAKPGVTEPPVPGPGGASTPAPVDIVDR